MLILPSAPMHTHPKICLAVPKSPHTITTKQFNKHQCVQTSTYSNPSLDSTGNFLFSIKHILTSLDLASRILLTHILDPTYYISTLLYFNIINLHEFSSSKRSLGMPLDRMLSSQQLLLLHSIISHQ